MIDVRSEIGRLRRVLVHEPGPEVDLMVPAMMDELLYDDILYGDIARDEHRLLCEVLDRLGVDTVQARTLLAEALAVDGGSQWILDGMARDLPDAVRERMADASPECLAGWLIEGIRLRPGSGTLEADDLFEVPPVPNFCFQRDPLFALGDSVLFCAMATATRWREAMLMRTVFHFHPDYAATRVLLDPTQPRDGRPLYLGLTRPSFEGGDLMVMNEDLVCVGYSERSNRAGVRQLARTLHRLEGGPRWLLVAVIPQKRAYMHLDTVFTQVDHDQCLAFPPVVEEGSSDSAPVYAFDLHADEPEPQPAGYLLPALRKRGVDLELLPCGGADPLRQAREQWTDGANALTIAPGVCVLYDRNVGTAETLARAGYDIVRAEDIARGDRVIALDPPRRTAILMPSNELSRARGGPHCLTHAFRREPA